MQPEMSEKAVWDDYLSHSCMLLLLLFCVLSVCVCLDPSFAGVVAATGVVLEAAVWAALVASLASPLPPTTWAG